MLERYAYLNAGTFGPLARATVEAMAAQLESDLTAGRGGTPYFESMVALRGRVRAGLAATIAVPPENVALTSSTTEACNIAVAGLRLAPDDEIVTTDTEHFGLLGPLKASGATIRVAEVRARPPEEALDVILAQITPKTRLLALSHVSWQTGNLLPVEELREATDVPMLVDGAQSAGAIAIDAAPYDFYTVSGQKWLCGPDATGALYVREPEALDVALPTYFSQDTHERGRGVRTARRRRAVRRRLACDLVPRRARGRARDGPALGAPPFPRHRCPLLGTPLRALRGGHRARPGNARLVRPSGRPAAVAAALYEQGVVARDLPGTGWLRVSCGWWTNDSDLDRLLDLL